MEFTATDEYVEAFEQLRDQGDMMSGNQVTGF